MKPHEIDRFRKIDERIARICENLGAKAPPDIVFKIVDWTVIAEAVAYNALPTNYSSIFFGRDYDRQRFKREEGDGRILEIVWNFDPVPMAFLLKENPLVVNALVDAHVRWHVDFMLRNPYMTYQRGIANIAEEARAAARRFDEYRAQYGNEEIDRVIAVGDAFAKYQDPNRLVLEEAEDEMREKLIAIEREKIERVAKDFSMSQKEREEKIGKLKKKIQQLEEKTPPRPVYDFLGYLIAHTPKKHKDYVYDIWNVQLHQWKFHWQTMVCTLLNEGWATYWHEVVMHQLFKEGLLTDKEYGVFVDSHSKVCARSRVAMNRYHTGPAFYRDIADRWNKGQFGPEYRACTDPRKREKWVHPGFEGAGRERIFEIASTCNDRMVLSDPELFSDEFIHDQQLYVWAEVEDEGGNRVFVIIENDPKVLRQILVQQHTLYGIPLISVEDGNYRGRKELFLEHHFFGFELDPRMEEGAMSQLFWAWGRPVHLKMYEITKRDERGQPLKVKCIIHSYDGKKHIYEDD